MFFIDSHRIIFSLGFVYILLNFTKLRVFMSKLYTKRVGQIIREKRESMGYTQHFIAKKLNHSPQFLSQIEKGQTTIPEHTLVKIVAMLDLDTNLIKDAMLADVESRIRSLKDKVIELRVKPH